MTRDEALIAAFADELRSRRAALRLSQEELAHRAGVNRTYIAKLELARNQPTLTVLLRVPSRWLTPRSCSSACTRVRTPICPSRAT